MLVYIKLFRTFKYFLKIFLLFLNFNILHNYEVKKMIIKSGRDGGYFKPSYTKKERKKKGESLNSVIFAKQVKVEYLTNMFDLTEES